MKYDQACLWLDSFQHKGIKLGLERMSLLLDALGHPEKELPVIHVAGTNGKGSVCRYVSSILSAEGYTVGLYMSPHLHSIRERFCINDSMISPEEFSTYISHLIGIVESIEQEENRPTYFEICTALSLLYFKDKKADFAVIEVGLGGRYDATNLVHPLVSVITSISYDHVNILGDTLEKIAFEKAGIIKNHVPLVTGAQGTALDVITQQAIHHESPVIIVDENSSTIQERSLSHQLIRIHGSLRDYVLETSEIGSYQQQNLAIAIHAIEQLQIKGVYVSPKSIEYGVKSMIHPGRMKQVHNHPIIFVDGAHNPDGIKQVKNTIESLFPKKQIILLFGVLQEKNIVDMVKEIDSIVDRIVLTKSSNPRALPPEKVYSLIASLFSEQQILLTDTINEGIRQCLDLSKPKDIILITGSLYTVQEALQYFVVG